MNTTSAHLVAWLGLVIAALPSTVVRADADRPVLVVPGSKAVFHAEVDLPEATRNHAGWQLVEIDKPGRRLAIQAIAKIAADGIRQRNGGRIVVDIPPAGDVAKPRRFRLEALPTGTNAPAAFVFSDDGPASLRIAEQAKPVFVYNHGMVTNERVPAKDARRSRGCYIHPLWGLNGEVLTDDFPADHYHHHGVFWAWPHVEIGREKFDLWEYKDIAQNLDPRCRRRSRRVEGRL
jgi:hypothetical protein